MSEVGSIYGDETLVLSALWDCPGDELARTSIQLILKFYNDKWELRKAFPLYQLDDNLRVERDHLFLVDGLFRFMVPGLYPNLADQRDAEKIFEMINLAIRFMMKDTSTFGFTHRAIMQKIGRDIIAVKLPTSKGNYEQDSRGRLYDDLRA